MFNLFNLRKDEGVKINNEDFNQKIGRLFKAYKDGEGDEFLKLGKGELDIEQIIPPNEALVVQVVVSDIFDKDSFDQSANISIKYDTQRDEVDINITCPHFNSTLKENVSRKDDIKISENGSDEKIVIERKVGGVLALYNNIESTVLTFRKL